MSGSSPRFYASLPMVAALLCSLAATVHAEENFINRMFTFREDQKPLVAPKYATVPKVVKQPYYPTDAHEAWSNFYTRSDLTPQDYLGSSASKVMRPNMASPYARAGWEAIAAQAKAQQEATTADTPLIGEAGATLEAPGNIAIGDPGNGLGMQSGDANIGRALEIGAPKKDWRDDPNSIPLSSRPGDYDYRAPVDVPETTRDSAISIGDARAAKATGKDPFAELNAAAQPESLKSGAAKYAARNEDGEVTRYLVQKGDTLKSIAAQSDIYGDRKLWPLIYSANRHVLGKSSAKLKSGLKLTIPRDYTEKQAKEARRKSGIK